MFFILVYGSLLSLFPLCQFFVYLWSSFLAFYALWQSCQKGEKFDIWMLFLKRVIDLGGELHVKGIFFFFCVTNLGGELVWYALMLICFEMCIFVLWFTCYHWDILLVYSASIVNKSFLELIYLTCQCFPHDTLMHLV